MSPRPKIPLLAAAAVLVTLPGCRPSVLRPPEPPPAASSSTVTPTPSTEGNYVFGWGQLPENLARPRGGTTRGTAVTLAPGQPLPLPEVASATDAFARDRAAIRALAGDYKVSFHFMESLGFAADYQPVRPYHSWATEHVRIIEDSGKFISLQHTLVMFFRNPDGTSTKPMLTKHWRQDWTWEDRDLHTFRGDDTWARRRPKAAESAGAWSQAVFQVDDSPRYEALGRWEHRGNASVWTSERAWRPLPRREHSVRSDYGVMEGVHRIILTATGWLHEQNNWKRIAGEKPSAGAEPRFVAAEIGLDRYERITAPSLVAADEYWEKTAGYWAAVRHAWSDTFARHARFKLRRDVDGKKLFEEHFAFAESLASGQPADAAAAEQHARSTVAAFLELKSDR